MDCGLDTHDPVPNDCSKWALMHGQDEVRRKTWRWYLVMWCMG